MLIKSPNDLLSSEITPESTFRARRQILKAGGVGAAALLLPGVSLANTPARREVLRYAGPVAHNSKPAPWLQEKVKSAVAGEPVSAEKVTPWEYVTQYNNFYEFGTGKSDPFENSRDFRSTPWTLQVGGHAEKTGKFALEDLIQQSQLEERIYRFRCVEAWSMVVPWIGIPLSTLLKQFAPTSNAQFVRFETVFDPEQMSGQSSRFSSIDWPYVEGLRIDEAMHDLAFLALGVYGQTLPPQNGAPLRLVVPWKYGFKSIKSIARIDFVEKRPRTTWEIANAREYGFYSNVNPQVDHPRWSQATERRLPSSLFNRNTVDTLMYNGYADQVAHLYAGMDLKRNF